MNMQRITISELSEPVRLFLSQVREGQGIVVEDESGRSQYGIIPYTEATPGEKARAWKQLERLQEKVGKAMTQAGVTEADVEKAILEDRAEAIEGIRRGLESFERGEGRPAKEAFEEIRKKYRIPRDA